MSKVKEVREEVEMEGRLLARWHVIIYWGDCMCAHTV